MKDIYYYSLLFYLTIFANTKFNSKRIPFFKPHLKF